MADQEALKPTGGGIEGGQRGDLGLDLLPLGQRVDEQALVLDIDGGDETPIALGHQGVAIPGRYRHAPLGVQIDWVVASKHLRPRLSLRANIGVIDGPANHFAPLYPTWGHYMPTLNEVKQRQGQKWAKMH